MPRLVVTCALALVSCDSDAPASSDASPVDSAPPIADADATIDDANMPDAPPDSPAPDTTAPQLVSIAPADATQIWLHDRIRFEFDEPILGVTGTARIGTTNVPVTITSDGDRAVLVRVAPDARGIGTLALELDTIRDVAGNVAPALAAQFTLAPWHRSSPTDDAALGSPALAVSDAGQVFAAAATGAPGARRIVVRGHERGAWRPLGGALGTASTSSPAIALDADERPVVAWIESSEIRAARWTGSGWLELPSLGTASAIALASPPGGGRITALVTGSSAAVFTLENDAWQPLGGTLPFGGSVVGTPVLAVPSGGDAVVGWIVTTAGSTTLRVHRYSSGWTALAPIAADATRLGVAARGSTIAIAWDDRTGSSGVYAARANGNAWTRLGRALDVDLAGDAMAPAIALDANSQPVVAWHERIETALRGVIARWNGSAWTIVGGHSWLAGPSTTPATLALHAGQSPVIGSTTSGVVTVARFNGPQVAAPGIADRASLAGCAFSAANPPARVRQTGCFTVPVAGKPVPHAGLIPYDLVVELWSDGALKRRWIALPNGTSMTVSGNATFTAPVGTFIIKEFAIETTPGNPATRRAIETRFLVRDATGWQGFSYRWRENGSDADLLIDAQFTFDWPLAGGGTHTHLYPSRQHCQSCHHDSYGPLLGLRPQQLARWFDYDGVIADQIATLASIDASPATTATPFPSPHDASANVEQRTRGYMAANCAHCHNPDYLAIKDLRFPTPLGQTRLCEVIVPGAPAQSRLYQLISSRPGMPALGTLRPDPLFTGLVDSWITDMSSCP